MPKLKVPGETHKPRPHGKKGSGERKLLLKSRSNNEKVVVGGGGGGGGKKSLLLGKRRNGTVKVPLRPRRDFYKTFGASDDEVKWELLVYVLLVIFYYMSMWSLVDLFDCGLTVCMCVNPVKNLLFNFMYHNTSN